MRRYKLIDTTSLSIVKLVDSESFKFVHMNTNDYPISSYTKRPDSFGIVTDDTIYNVYGFSGTPHQEYLTVYMEMIGLPEWEELAPLLVKHNTVTPPEIIEEQLQELAFLQSSKIQQLSEESKKQIENGIDVVTSMGTEHFDLTVEDQLNLYSIQLQLLRNATELIYHSKDMPSRIYSAAELQAIIDAANLHIQYHTVRFNTLKHYVLTLSTISEISAVTYDTEITN